MKEIKEIENLISSELKKIAGKVPENSEENLLLFMTQNGKPIVDLLYFFEALENAMKIPVARVLEKRSYHTLSIRGLAQAIIEDFA